MTEIKQFVDGFKKGQKMFGETIAVIVNSVLLTLVYIVGIGITSIVARIFKKKFLETEILFKERSYWNDLNLHKKKLEEYYRQF